MCLSAYWPVLLRLLLLLQIAIGTVLTIDRINGISYFETVTHVMRQSRVKKSIEKGLDRLEYASFQAFNRSFNIILKRGTDVLAKNFEAKVIQTNGRTNTFFVNVNDHFMGHLLDDPTIDVDGHMEDTMISLTIFDHQDMYVLEPARIYNRGPNANEDRTWIAYRYSDTQIQGKGMGMHVHNTGNQPFCVSDPNKFPITNATKRAVKRPRSAYKTGNKLTVNVCSMLVVATYNLFKDRCKSSIFVCAQLLIANVYYADRVFSSTDFGIFSGIHLRIQKMMVFEKPTMSGDNEMHFNEQLDIWSYSKLLKSFNQYVRKHTSDYCVKFLFNAHHVSGNVLGLAYIGATCSMLNTGFATCRSDPNTIISTLRNRVLFTHGHLFGSCHDPESAECYKPSNRGGNYIMWPYITEGQCANCQKFSVCSKKSINLYLSRSYSRDCFTEEREQSSFCGNGVVEQGEECDEGFRSTTGISCCNNTCAFVGNAVCSDSNSGCCFKCNIAPKGHLCRGKWSASCLDNSFCDGESLECPDSPPKPDDYPCKGHGRCYQGLCQSYCVHRGRRVNRKLESCMCSQNAVTGCKVCCFDATYANNPGQCLARGKNLNLTDNRPCFIGVCKKGICTLSAEKTFEVYDLISGFDLTRGAMFMRDNVVSTILVLSVLVWIPAAWAISEIDKNVARMQEDDEESYFGEGSVAPLTRRNAPSLFFKDKHTVLQISPSNLMLMSEPGMVKKSSRKSSRRSPSVKVSQDMQSRLGSE